MRTLSTFGALCTTDVGPLVGSSPGGPWVDAPGTHADALSADQEVLRASRTFTMQSAPAPSRQAPLTSTRLQARGHRRPRDLCAASLDLALALLVRVGTYSKLRAYASVSPLCYGTESPSPKPQSEPHDTRLIDLPRSMQMLRMSFPTPLLHQIWTLLEHGWILPTTFRQQFGLFGHGRTLTMQFVGCRP